MTPHGPGAPGGVAADVAAADVAAYALRLGDDALVLAQRTAEWVTAAPQLEEDVALANIGLDLLGQARALLTRAGELADPARTEDDLAYFRAERAFTNCQLVELPRGDFARTIARLLLVASYQELLYGALAGSRDPALAAVAGKAVKEVAYHRDHAVTWTLRLGDGTAESHARMQAGLDYCWPYAAELFETDPLLVRLVAAGVAADPAVLQPAWDGRLAGVLAAAGLHRPEPAFTATGGRSGRHTEHLGYLLAELQHLARSHPGATW